MGDDRKRYNDWNPAAVSGAPRNSLAGTLIEPSSDEEFAAPDESPVAEPVSAKPPPPRPLPDKASIEDRAKMFEAVLRANPTPIRVESKPEAKVEAKPEAGEEKPKKREVLYRGMVFVFRPIGPPSGQDRRNGVIERWQTDSSIDDCAFSLVVREFFDGRFTPWSFDGIFFNDFLQAATVGVITSILEAHGLKEQWRHEQTRRKFLFFVFPAVALASLLIGWILGYRHG